MAVLANGTNGRRGDDGEGHEVFSSISAAAKRRRVAAFWTSVIAVPAASVIVIMALSRQLAAGELAKVTTVFSLSFIAAVLPMAAQSQAAADVASSGRVGRIHWRPIQLTVLALAITAPLLATTLGLPLLSVLLPVIMVIPAVAVGAARGELIAKRSFRFVAVNHWIDAGTRVIAGVTLGLLFGASGVGASLLLATALSWLVLPLLPEDETRELRLPTALIASALLTLSIHLDVLLAPRLLGAGADAFAVAVLPAEGVFLALMAAGWLVIPAAVGFHTARDVIKPVALTATAGVVLTIGAVVAIPVMGLLLGRGNPERGLVLVLGLSMAAAAGNWVCLQIRLARGSTTLWHPAMVAIAVTVAGGFATRSAPGLAWSILFGQGAALVLGAFQLVAETTRTPVVVPEVGADGPIDAAPADPRRAAPTGPAPATVATAALSPGAIPTGTVPVGADEPQVGVGAAMFLGIADAAAAAPGANGTNGTNGTNGHNGHNGAGGTNGHARAEGIHGADVPAAAAGAADADDAPLASFEVTGSVLASARPDDLAHRGDADVDASLPSEGSTARPTQPLYSTTPAGRLHARRARSPKPAIDPHQIKGVVTNHTQTPRAALAWISALLVLAAGLQQPGDIVAETKLDVSVDALTFLSRIWHLWEPVADMGHVQNQAVGYLFPMGPFFAIGQLLHVPLWMIQRGWMGLLLVVAFWGLARLADELEIGSPTARILGALAYALSPFFIARIGATSAFVIGGAMLPWIMLPLVRASRKGSIRRGAALSGLAVLAIGGVNAAVTLAVLVAPLVWLLTRERGRRRNQLLGWWLLAVFLATAWWIVPLFFQLKYGFNFLPYTERASTTTAYTSTPEVLRGTGDWLSYLHLREGWLPAGWALVAEPVAIVGSCAMAAFGLFGLARRDLKQRAFLLLSFLVGVAIVGAGYGGVFGNPVAGVVRTMLDGPAGLFRNVYKFQPLVALPLAFGTIHTLQLLLDWSRVAHPKAATPTWLYTRATQRRIHALAPLALLLLVLVAALPLASGQLVSDKGFEEVPSWWADAQKTQEELVAPGRALILPGIPAGDYTWGRPLDEPLQTTTDTPFALRSLIPLGGPGSTRVLDAVELTIERGGDTGLIPFLQRAGVDYVIARNDVNWRDWNAPRPLQTHRALISSGLTRSRSFGPTLPLDIDPADPGFAVDGAEHDLHAIELYRVSAPKMVGTYPVSTAAVMSGGPEAAMALSRVGLGDRATILPGDLPAGKEPPSTWLITDTLRRRYVEFGLMRSNFSYTLDPDENAPDGKPVTTQLVPDAGTQHQTVARIDGVRSVTASSYGSWLYQIPEAAPFNALDADASTVWVAGPTHTSEGEWWRTDFLKPVDTSTIQVRLIEDGPWRPRVTALRVTTERGTTISSTTPDESLQTIAVPPGATSWMKISFETVDGETTSSAGAGLRDVVIPGVTMHRELVTPSEMLDQFSDPSKAAPIYLFERTTSDPRSLLRNDEEVTLERGFTVPREATFAVTATATAVPGDKLFDLLHGDQSNGLRITASSTLSSLPEYDPQQLLDDRDDTFWAAQPPDAVQLNAPAAPGRDTPTDIGPNPKTDQVAPVPQKADDHPKIHLEWNHPRVLESVKVTAAAGFSRPRSLKISSSDGDRDALIGPDGVAVFPAIATNAVDVTFPDIDARTTRNPLDGSLTALPVGLAGLRFPGLEDLAPARLDVNRPIRVECADGPTLTIDGVVHHFSIDTSAAGLSTLAPIPIKDCGPDVTPADAAETTGAVTAASAAGSVTLGRGQHHLSGAPGKAPFNITTLVLRDPVTAGAPGAASASASEARGVRMLQWGKEDRRLDIDPGTASYLTIDENFSSGWRATLDGQTLDPIRIDGWRQAFIVPAGRGGVVQLHFEPGGSYRAGLVLGGLLVLLLLGLAFVPDRQVVRPGKVDEAHLPWWLWTGAAVIATVWITGAAAILLLPVWWLGRKHTKVLPALAAGAMVVSGALVVLGAGHGPGDHLGTFGWAAQLVASLAVVAIAASITHGPRGGWQAWWSTREESIVLPPIPADTEHAAGAGAPPTVPTATTAAPRPTVGPRPGRYAPPDPSLPPSAPPSAQPGQRPTPTGPVVIDIRDGHVDAEPPLRREHQRVEVRHPRYVHPAVPGPEREPQEGPFLDLRDDQP
jgi:arabinofuranan 3-O-arabinosyltransferase